MLYFSLVPLTVLEFFFFWYFSLFLFVSCFTNSYFFFSLEAVCFVFAQALAGASQLAYLVSPRCYFRPFRAPGVAPSGAMDKVMNTAELLSQQNPFSGAENLPTPPRPEEVLIPRDRPSVEQIPFIQQQINLLTYNHLPRTFFSLEKHRALQYILYTAKEVLAEALPIRCLEATFVALYLTQPLKDIDRIPLSFKSEANGCFYRHIVLVVRARATPPLYGALGLSRKSTLMYKPLAYRSLFEIVMNYKHEYEMLGHQLVDIRLGIAMSHDEHCKLDPCWRFIALKLDRFYHAEGDIGEAEAEKVLDSSKASGEPPLASTSTTATTSNGVSSGPSSAGSGSGQQRDGCIATSTAATTVGPSAFFRSPRKVDEASAEPCAALPCTPSPSFVAASSSLTLPAPSHDPDAAYAELAHFLSNYTRLLTTISDQYYKSLPSLDSTNRAVRLCFLDLDLAERDASMENQRRLDCILNLQSPLGFEARRIAAGRQLKPPKKERPGRRGKQQHHQTPVGSKTRTLSLPASCAPQTAAAEGDPARRPRLWVRNPTASPAASLGVESTASPIGLPSCRLTASQRRAMTPARQPRTSNTARPISIRVESPIVDGQSTASSSTHIGGAATEGYLTPRDQQLMESRGNGNRGAPVLLTPLTPRHYSTSSPLSASSSSDLFSQPSSLNRSGMGL